LILDKAKPSVRRGRKAAGLQGRDGDLPKEESAVSSAFIFLGFYYKWASILFFSFDREGQL
jgi:hypothetical protein